MRARDGARPEGRRVGTSLGKRRGEGRRSMPNGLCWSRIATADEGVVWGAGMLSRNLACVDTSSPDHVQGAPCTRQISPDRRVVQRHGIP